MLKRALVMAAICCPQWAIAADMAQPRRHRRVEARVVHEVEQNKVVHCTTTSLGLFSYSDCGQTFDPLAIAGE